MKRLSVLLMVSLFASAAFAASPFLPISATNTFASAERIAIEAAIAKGEAEGKPVMIDLAAAWCGPCLQLDKEIEARKEEIQPLLDKFVFVKTEEMHFEMMAGIDFLSTDIGWFPSIALFNPATGKWTMIAATNVDLLKMNLTDYLAQAELGEFYTKMFLDALNAGQQVSAGLIFNGLLPLALEATGPRYLEVVKTLGQFMDQNPGLFAEPVSEIRDYITLAHTRAIETGKVTYVDLVNADASSFPGISQNFGLVQNLNFSIPLGILVRQQGNKAAADQCQALSARAAQLLKLAPADNQRALQVQRDLQCLHFDVQLQQKSGAEVRAYRDGLSEDERRVYSESLLKVLSSTGTDFDLAIEHATIIDAAYKKAFAKHPELLARVTKAMADRIAALQAGKSHP